MKKVVLTIIVAIFMTSCSSGKLEKHNQTFLELDTAVSLIGYTKDEATFKKYTDLTQNELVRYHQLFDRFNAYPGVNNVYTLNEQAYLHPVVVDQAIIDVLKIYQTQNNEQVKMTLAPVSDIWKQAENTLTVPTSEQLESVRACVNDNAVVINEQTREVSFTNPCTKLDLGAVAKGYIIEHVAVELENAGLKNGILNGGGNVRTIGSNLDHKPWKIGVVDPDFPNDAEKAKLILLIDHSSSVVTSGDYQRYFEVNGVRYHHLIDADTFLPAKHFRSVTVLLDDSTMADYYSTMLFLTPLEQGQQIVANTQGLEAIWILNDGTVVQSENIPIQ